MNEWTPICRIDDIPVLGSRRVARPQGLDVAVFRNDMDEVFALLDRCPHKGGPLSQGIVFGTSVACPPVRRPRPMRAARRASKSSWKVARCF